MNHFELKSFEVLSEFHVQVDHATLGLHQVLSIEAPSGFGKTTLLRGLLGLEKTKGEFWLDGKRVDSLKPEDRNIGMVFQDHLLFPHLNAVENVAFGLRMRKVPKKEAHAQAKAAMDDFGLSEKYDAPITVLSGGERQRLSILRAVIWKPKLLILDEPFTGLDEARKEKVVEFLTQFNAQNRMNVIFVSHPTDQSPTFSTNVSARLVGDAPGDATHVRKFSFHRS